GNLDALPEGSRYQIFTAPGDQSLLARATRLLRAVLPVDVVAVDEEGHEGRYSQMTHYHRRAITDARGAALIFASPDSLLSTDALRYVVARHAVGMRAVVVPPVRLTKESVLPALVARGSAAFAPRELVRFALDHLHPATLAYMADASRFNAFPTGLQWRVGEEGMISRSFHLYPLMLAPVHLALPARTIDSNYIEHCVPNMEDIDVVTDSDVLAMFDLTAKRRYGGRAKTRTMRIWRLASVAGRCSPHHLLFWRHAIRLHTDVLDARWSAVEKESAAIADLVLARRHLARRLHPMLRVISSMQQRVERRARDLRRRAPRLRLKRIVRVVAIARKRVRRKMKRPSRGGAET
ncbi:MAG: hypothetical protein HYX77_04170, partial [Acidobacteria bacterium]|nr:hypothetical protein [Acidobacteriota bacterium]